MKVGFTKREISKIQAMRSAGKSWSQIALAMECSGHKVRCAVDPEYKARSAKANAKYKKAIQYGQRNQSDRPGRGMSAENKAQAERLMKMVPPDTRTLTQRMFGDPLPGRSALDQKRMAK